MKKSETPPGVETNATSRDEAGLELEFPDAPDFISRPSRRTLAEMLPLLEEFRRWPQVMKSKQPQERCLVEFVL